MFQRSPSGASGLLGDQLRVHEPHLVRKAPITAKLKPGEVVAGPRMLCELDFLGHIDRVEDSVRRVDAFGELKLGKLEIGLVDPLEAYMPLKRIFP